jgi:hypothetical protein
MIFRPQIKISLFNPCVKHPIILLSPRIYFTIFIFLFSHLQLILVPRQHYRFLVVVYTNTFRTILFFLTGGLQVPFYLSCFSTIMAICIVASNITMTLKFSKIHKEQISDILFLEGKSLVKGVAT